MVTRRRSRRPHHLALPLGVTPEELVDLYPRLYHMAEARSWPSIRTHGLLSTSALLSLFEVVGHARTPIESAHRPESVTITHPQLGQAVVRDQKPMRDADLKRCLEDGMPPRDWYRLLNSKVFFWLTEERLETLLGARAYRHRPHTTIVLDAGPLIVDCAQRVLLSPMNSGCTTPFAHPRGRKTFLPLSEYPFSDRLRRSRANALVELAVEEGVFDVERYVIEVCERAVGKAGKVIWRR